MVFDEEARAPLLSGVSKLAKAVRSTLGPRGRNAILDKGWGSPKITKDGVTVAEDIELDDPNENLGVQLVKEAVKQDQRCRWRRNHDRDRFGRSDLSRRFEDDCSGLRSDGLVPRHRQSNRRSFGSH